MTHERPRGLRLLGLFLPVLGGGNLFLFLEPEPALVVLGALIGGVALDWSVARPSEASGGASAFVPLSIFVGIWLLSFTFRSTGPRAATETEALLMATLLFMVFRRRPLATPELRTLVATLTVGTLITVAYGQYQYWVAFPRIAPIMRAAGAEPILSVNANFYNANCYAPFLAAIAILVVPMLFDRDTGARGLAAVGLAGIFVTLMLTGSRATIALLAATGALVPALRSVARRRPSALAWAMVVGIVVFAAAFAQSSELVQVGLLGRLQIWHAATRMIADHWMIGVGLGGFAEQFYRYRLGEYYTRYPHNLGLEVFAELGIIAAASLCVFLVFAGRDAATASRPWSITSLRTATALAALLLVVHAFLDIDWQAPANPILLFLLLAVAGAGDPETVRPKRSPA
jgi:O-antigen ligase